MSLPETMTETTQAAFQVNSDTTFSFNFDVSNMTACTCTTKHHYFCFPQLRRKQFGQSRQIVGTEIEQGVSANSVQTAGHQATQRADVFRPAERLLNHLSPTLADGIGFGRPEVVGARLKTRCKRINDLRD